MAAAETAKMIAEVDMRTAGFTKGIKQVERGVDRVDKKLGAFSGFMNRNLSRAIDSLAARGIDALGDAVQAGSDLNEEITKSQAVFGKSAGEILAWSDTTSSALGIAKKDALAAAGGFGNMFKTIGLAEPKAEDMSERLVELAADMASFNNEDPTEVLLKLRSGLAGEAEPLRRMGVLLSEARVKEEAYASGIAKRGDKLTEGQKVLARYALILKDTAVQQGDVAKTGGNLAGQQRKLNAMLKDVSATIGTALLPAVTDITSEFVKLFQDPETQKGIKAFAKDLGKGASELVKSLKGVNWKGFADALGMAAGFAKDIVTAFLGMPSWVQAVLIGAFAGNKLTGGGVTSLLGKAFGKGIDLFSGRGSSPANPLFVSGSGMGGGGLGGAGKGGRFGRFGALGTAVAGTISVALVGETVALWQQINDTSTEQANTAQENLNNMLAQDATLGDMLIAQQATRDGIKDIRANPLLTLVQGEALDRLTSMDAQLTEAIEEKARPAIKAQAPANLAANQASIASREGGGKLTAKELQDIQAKVAAAARSAQNASSIANREASALNDKMLTVKEKQQATTNAVKNAQSISSRENAALKQETALAKQAAATAGRNNVAAARRTEFAARTAGTVAAIATALGSANIVGAINALDLSVNVTTVNRTSTVNNRYGPSGGSSGYQRIPGAG